MLSDMAEQNHVELVGAGWPMRAMTECESGLGLLGTLDRQCLLYKKHIY